MSARPAPQSIYRFAGHLPPDVVEQITGLVDEHAQDLYTGRSNNLPARVKEHSNTRGKWAWWPDTDLILVDHMPPGASERRTARRERVLIRAREPWFNTDDNPAGFNHAAYNDSVVRHWGALGGSWWERHVTRRTQAWWWTITATTRTVVVRYAAPFLVGVAVATVSFAFT